MANEKAHLSGVYEVSLCGEVYPLKRVMGAIEDFNYAEGGLINFADPRASTVTSRVYNRDLNTIAFVIRRGLDKNFGPAALPDLKKKIFDEGVETVAGHVLNYLFMLRTKPGTPIPFVTPAEEGDAGDERPQKAEPSPSVNTGDGSSRSPPVVSVGP